MALLRSSGWSRQGERGGWAASIASPSGSMTVRASVLEIRPDWARYDNNKMETIQTTVNH